MQLDSLLKKHGDVLYIALDNLKIQPADTFSNEQVAQIEAEIAKISATKKTVKTSRARQVKRPKEVSSIFQKEQKTASDQGITDLDILTRQAANTGGNIGRTLGYITTESLCQNYLQTTAEGIKQFQKYLDLFAEQMELTVTQSALEEIKTPLLDAAFDPKDGDESSDRGLDFFAPPTVKEPCSA